MNGATKFSLQFLKQIALTVGIVGVLGFYPLLKYASGEVIQAVTGGVLLSIVNVLMGYAAIEYSFGKSYTQFIQVVMGAIVVRLIVMVVLLLILILVFKLHVIALVSSLFAMYVIFLVIEVLYIHNKWQGTIHTQKL